MASKIPPKQKWLTSVGETLFRNRRSVITGGPPPPNLAEITAGSSGSVRSRVALLRSDRGSLCGISRPRHLEAAAGQAGPSFGQVPFRERSRWSSAPSDCRAAALGQADGRRPCPVGRAVGWREATGWRSTPGYSEQQFSDFSEAGRRAYRPRHERHRPQPRKGVKRRELQICVLRREWDGPAALPPPTALRVRGGLVRRRSTTMPRTTTVHAVTAIGIDMGKNTLQGTSNNCR
jgi:hypothetical protein